MQNKPFRDILRTAYDRYAQERDTQDMPEWKIVERLNFLAHLRQEHKKTFLEIGAGTGRDSKFFQDQGLETVCIDLSPVMVELCKRKGLKAFIMDAGDMQFPEASFDAAYAMNSLLHIPKAELPAVLRRIDGFLKTGGLFYVGVYGGDDFEGIWEDDPYTPHRFFSYFTDENLEQAVTEVFDIVSFNRVALEPEDTYHFQSLILKKRLQAEE